MASDLVFASNLCNHSRSLEKTAVQYQYTRVLEHLETAVAVIAIASAHGRGAMYSRNDKANHQEPDKGMRHIADSTRHVATSTY